MKVNKMICIEYEVHRKLNEVNNASNLIENLLIEYFNKQEKKHEEIEVMEVSEQAVKKADALMELVNNLQKEFYDNLGREYTNEEWLEFYNRWESQEKGFGIFSYVAEVLLREQANAKPVNNEM